MADFDVSVEVKVKAGVEDCVEAGVLITIRPSLLSMTSDSKKPRTCINGDFIFQDVDVEASEASATRWWESDDDCVPVSVFSLALLIWLRKFCKPPTDPILSFFFFSATLLSISSKSVGEYLSAKPWRVAGVGSNGGQD